MSDSRALALLLSLPPAELKHVDWHTGADLFLCQHHSIIEDLEELLRLLLLVQLIVERVLQGDMQKTKSPESYRCVPVVNVCPVYTWICVFPPLRSAMPIKMLSSKIRSFLVLTMRSMTSSDAPTLSSAHWMSTKLVPGLSESCPGKPPMYIQNTVESGMRGAEVRREDLQSMVSQQSFCWWSFTSRGRAVPAAVLQGFGVGPMVAKVVYKETLPQCVTLRKPERKAVGSSFKYGVYQIFRFFRD